MFNLETVSATSEVRDYQSYVNIVALNGFIYRKVASYLDTEAETRIHSTKAHWKLLGWTSLLVAAMGFGGMVTNDNNQQVLLSNNIFNTPQQQAIKDQAEHSLKLNLLETTLGGAGLALGAYQTRKYTRYLEAVATLRRKQALQTSQIAAI